MGFLEDFDRAIRGDRPEPDGRVKGLQERIKGKKVYANVPMDKGEGLIGDDPLTKRLTNFVSRSFKKDIGPALDFPGNPLGPAAKALPVFAGAVKGMEIAKNIPKLAKVLSILKKSPKVAERGRAYSKWGGRAAEALIKAPQGLYSPLKGVNIRLPKQFHKGRFVSGGMGKPGSIDLFPIHSAGVDPLEVLGHEGTHSYQFSDLANAVDAWSAGKLHQRNFPLALERVLKERGYETLSPKTKEWLKYRTRAHEIGARRGGKAMLDLERQEEVFDLPMSSEAWGGRMKDIFEQMKEFAGMSEGEYLDVLEKQIDDEIAGILTR